MKPRHPLVAVFLAGLLGTLAASVQAAVVRGETVTAAEEAAMPPLCKLIVIEKPNAHIDKYAQQKNAALFDRPEYRMAKNAHHVHHWCRAVISRMRYYAARTEQQRRAYMGDFYDEMDYVIRNTDPAWPYLPMMHAEKGEMYLIDKNLPQAMSQAISAIKLNPAFARGFVLLVNVYTAMGQKDKALEAATEGLRYNPTSNALKKMYGDLGGAKPYPEPIAKPEPSAPAPAAVSESSTQSSPAVAGEFKSANEEEAVTPPEDAASPPPDSAAPESGGRKKYCRFCP